MLQRITDMWPDLLRRGGAENSDVDNRLLGEQSDSDQHGQALS